MGWLRFASALAHAGLRNTNLYFLVQFETPFQIAKTSKYRCNNQINL